MLSELLVAAAAITTFQYNVFHDGAEYAAEAPGYGVSAVFEIDGGHLTARALPTFGQGTVRYEIRYRNADQGLSYRDTIDAIPASCVQHQVEPIHAIVRMCGKPSP